MAALGSLVVELSANIAKFETAMSRASYVANQNMKQVQGSIDSLKGTLEGLAGIVAGVFAFEGLKSFLDDLTEAGAKTEKLTASMQAMGSIYGLSTDSLKLVSEQIQTVGITASEAAGSINAFIQYGIEITKLPRLAQMAADLSAIDQQGRTTREMFDLLINAIGRGPRALTQLRLGSGEEFKALSADIKKTTDEAFLSMPERANLAFQLLEKATKQFEGVSSSVLDTYKIKQQEAAKAAEEFKVALFDLAKPVLSAVLQQEINSWGAFTAALIDNKTALSQTGEALALVVGRIANSVGTVVSFVAAHKEWAEAILGLYGLARLSTLVGALAATLTTALISVGQFILGLTTLKGLVSSPWPPIIITVAAVGIAAVLTQLRQVIQTKLEASGVLNPNLATRPVSAGPRDEVLSAAGSQQLSPEGRSKLVQQVDAQAAQTQTLVKNAQDRIAVLESQLQVTTAGLPQERLAQLESIRAARQRQQEQKTTLPNPGGKSSAGAEQSMASFIETMHEQTAKGAGDTEAILGAWYGKQLASIQKWKDAGLNTTAALDAADEAYYAKLEKLNSDFNDWYIAGLGKTYEALYAEEDKKLKEVAGNAAKTAQVQEVFSKKWQDLQENQQLEATNLFKGYLDTMSQLSPLLSQQLGYKQQALNLEIKLANEALDRQLRDEKITQDTYDQAKAMQAVVNQAKLYSLEREKWAGQGFSGGLQTAYVDSQQAAATWQANEVASFLKSAPQTVSQEMATDFVNFLQGKKTDLQALSYSMAQTLIQKQLEGFLTELMPQAIQGVMQLLGIELPAKQTAAQTAATTLETGGVNAGVAMINAAIQARNILSGSSGGGADLGGLFSGLFGGGSSTPANLGAGSFMDSINAIQIPHAAAGGIVTGPTLALIGENGPEKITPLGSSGETPTQVNVIINNNAPNTRASAKQQANGDLIVTIDQLTAQAYARGGLLQKAVSSGPGVTKR